MLILRGYNFEDARPCARKNILSIFLYFFDHARKITRYAPGVSPNQSSQLSFFWLHWLETASLVSEWNN